MGQTCLVETHRHIVQRSCFLAAGAGAEPIRVTTVFAIVRYCRRGVMAMIVVVVVMVWW